MKRITLVVLSVILMVTLAAGCLKSEPPTATTESPASETTAPDTDANTSASPNESSDPDAIVKGLSADGNWIFALLSDVTVDKTINVDGEFHDKGDASAKLYRKLALYAQDENRNVIAEYTLTVPEIVVTSPSFRIQQGTVKGNVVVDADGFELVNCTIDGDLTFKTQAQMDSANLEQGTVTGTVSVG